MTKRLSLIALIPALLIAACNSSPSVKPDASAEPMNPVDFSRAVTDASQSTLELGKALADDEVGVALSNLPAGNPVGGFMSATEMYNLARPNLKVANSELSTLTMFDGDMFKLERGVYIYDEDIQVWEQTGESDDFVASWSFEYKGATLEAKATVDWDASNATKVVSDGYHNVEAPTGMNLSMSINGAKAADLDAEFDWYESATCGDTYQPVRVKVDGFIGSSDKVTLDNVSYRINPKASTDTVLSSGKVTALAGADSAKLSWNVDWDAQLSEDEDCFLSGFDKVTASDISFSYDVSASGEKSGLDLAVRISDVKVSYPYDEASDTHKNTSSLMLSKGSLEIDGKGRVEFAGTLDDSDQNGVPGENVRLSFAGDQSLSLEAFIRQNFLAAASLVLQFQQLR